MLSYLSVATNESEILPSTLDVKIIEDENNKLEEKFNNFEDLKVKISNFKFELNKKYQKLDEVETESNKKIAINKNYYPSVIVKELERDHKLFLEGHTSGIYCIAITSDNKYIISGS